MYQNTRTIVARPYLLNFGHQHLFKTLLFGSKSLRELNIWTQSDHPEVPDYNFPLPAEARHFSFSSLARIYCSLTSGIIRALDAARVLHAPHLDDLTICYANSQSRVPPEFFPSAALKRYAPHHLGYNTGNGVSNFSGWSRPLSSSIASLQSLELSIQNPDDLVECGLPALLERGALFFQLKTLSLSMGSDQHFESFMPLAMLCPRVQDLVISFDVTGLSYLNSFGRLINMLPNSVALKRLTIGLRTGTLQFMNLLHMTVPPVPSNESFDNHLAMLLQLSSAQRLQSFSIFVGSATIVEFGFPQVAKMCRSRRIVFDVEWYLEPGTRV